LLHDDGSAAMRTMGRHPEAIHTTTKDRHV
jgi:hypothetical protein